jgi:hypothetical protein
MLDYRDVVKNYIKDCMQADFIDFISDNSLSFLKILTVRVKKNDIFYDVTFSYDDLNKKDLVMEEVVEL